MPGNFEQRRVLIGNFEKQVARAIRYLLKEEGFQISEATNRNEVVNKVRASAPDLILLDISMPNLENFETLEIVRKISDAPVIFLTEKDKNTIQSLDAGADDYTLKPFSPDELVNRVKTALLKKEDFSSSRDVLNENEYDEIEAVIDVMIEHFTQKTGIREKDHKPFTVDEAHEADLREWENSKRNILGFGFGKKIKDGKPQKDSAIAIFVVRKAPANEVHPDFLAENFSSSFLMDVVEVGQPRQFHHKGQKFPRRVPGGAHIGNKTKSTNGTLGGWLKDDKGNYYLLSCSHCFGNKTKGDVFQPAGGNKIASIAATIVPKDCLKSEPTIDACIARIDDDSFLGDFILEIGEIRGLFTKATAFMSVQKSGASTHLTTGGITWLKGNMHLRSVLGGNTVFYDKQIIVQAMPNKGIFADDGDSGSIVMVNHYVLGLLVGGDNTPPNFTYVVTPIREIFKKFKQQYSLNLEFVTYP